MHTDGGLTYSHSAVSEVSGESNEDTIRSGARDFINIDEVKIESKDHMWRPAPIVGREFNQRAIHEPEVYFNNGYRGPLTNNYMGQQYRTISDTSDSLTTTQSRQQDMAASQRSALPS